MPAGLYVYGVVRSAQAATEPPLAGIDGQDVMPIDAGPVAALASPVTAGRIRPSRANIQAHHRVVGDTHAEVPVLPVRFGTVLPDEESLTADFLRPNLDRFEAALSYMAGKDEFRLRASYLPDVALREVVARSAPVRRMRGRLAGRRPAGRHDLIEMGEVVAAELEQIRETDAAELIEAVAGDVDAVRRLPDRSDTVAVHAALLVSRDRHKALDRQVERIAEKHGDRLSMELIGPLPPWDFVDEAFS